MKSINIFRVHNSFHYHYGYTRVDFDQFKVGTNNDLIGTDGLSCCLAITLYNPAKRMGAMAHINNLHDSPEDVTAEKIVDTLLKALDLTPKLKELSSLKATLSGKDFTHFVPEIAPSTIVKPILEKYGIPIIGEDLGPIEEGGRLVFLFCCNGFVEVNRV